MNETQDLLSGSIRTLSRDEVANLLGVAPLTVSRWVSGRRIGALRIARRLRFTSAHLQAFLDDAEVRVRR